MQDLIDRFTAWAQDQPDIYGSALFWDRGLVVKCLRTASGPPLVRHFDSGQLHKSIDDLSSCCLAGNRDRFEHKLQRLRGYRFKRLLVVGTREDIAAGRYHSRISPKAVLRSARLR
jgi:hypothetical protein